FDARFRTRASANQLLERFIVLGPAIRVAGTVLSNRSDVERARADGFRPTDADAQKMSVAKRDVSHGDGAGPPRRQVIFRDGHARMGERGTANRGEIVEPDGEAISHLVKVRDI